MAIKNVELQKKDAGGTLTTMHPQTSAEQVLYDDGTVKDALDNIGTTIESGVVSGVKGHKESTYRKGNVNLTSVDIGAEKEGAVSSHNMSETAHNDIRTKVTVAQKKADDAFVLAEGRSQAFVFDTFDTLYTELENVDETAFRLGDNLLIKDTDVPDYWVSGIFEVHDQPDGGTYDETVGYYGISELETRKLDLAPYQKKVDSGLNAGDGTVVGAINALGEDAGAAMSRAAGVEANLDKVIDGTTTVSKATTAETATSADSATKLKTVRTITVDINSGVGTNGTGNTSFDGTANKTITVALPNSGVTAGTYSALAVNSRGIVTGGAQIVEYGTAGQTEPSSDLAVGGLFFKEI